MMVRAWIVLPEDDDDFPAEEGRAEIWLRTPPSWIDQRRVKPIVYARLDEERTNFK